MRSRITGGKTEPIFTAEVLGKYKVQYFRCVETGFIQTEDPYWLAEAYSDAITALDLGLVSRNISVAGTAAAIIEGWFDRDGCFVDYGGGYGMFVRLMRDRGYDFRRVDPFCVNLFAKTFDWQPAEEQRVEMLTAWEVFEHLPDPLEGVRSMLEITDTVVFSTLLAPAHPASCAQDWWYFIPETGQHVSLYTSQALERIAAMNGLRFHTDGVSLHILTAKPMRNPFRPAIKWKAWNAWTRTASSLHNRAGKRSLLQKDFDAIRAGLQSQSISSESA